MKITLTPQQKLQLEQMHDIERDSRVCDRIKAVLLASEGWSQTMISQALRIHEPTVARHLSDYALSEKLKPENGASQSKLSAIQTMQLIEHLTEKTYSHTHQIVAYVKETFRLDYTVSDMNKWLHYNGFSYKQPKGIPHKFDAAKQPAFIAAYEALKASFGKDESIVFIDAVHPTLLTDIRWELLLQVMKNTGRIDDKTEHRMTFEGILYRMRTGIPWRDLPLGFGEWSSVYRRFNLWSKKGVLDKLI